MLNNKATKKPANLITHKLTNLRAQKLSPCFYMFFPVFIGFFFVRSFGAIVTTRAIEIP